MKKRLILSLISIALFSCNDSSVKTELKQETTNLDGKKLMEKNCYSCHNTQGTDNMLAPPMHRVKDHYWDEETSKEDFVTAIVEWCENPSEDKSVMHGARRKFGLMPKQSFDREEVEAIASYLFDTDSDQACCSH
mgnify:CR=1 FL=1